MVKKRDKIENAKGRSKTGKETHKSFEISFHSPEAMSVYVAGEFNGWDTQSLPLEKGKDGVWRSKIKLLPGRYEYKFFADNTWIENLSGVETIPNPFGTQNFIISVK